jgi:[acyl-carrier-protein] S-malonyltransferase
MAKVAFLFPGQGAQYVGMAKALCDSFSPARAIFDRASELLGYDLADVCFNGPESRLHSTEVSQPAIFVASWAALARLRQERPEVVSNCEAACGLSLGEYTALAFADSFSFDEGVKLVQARGQAMEQAAGTTPSGMCSVIGGDRAQAESLCAQARSAGRAWPANLLCPGNTALSGENAAVDAILTLAESSGLKAVRLAVAGAFHTEIMRPADEHLAAVLTRVPVREPQLTVLSNVDTEPHSSPDAIRQRLVRQVVSPVLWEDCMRRLLDGGFNTFYEIGPGRVLRGLMRRIDRQAACENVEA